MMLSCRDAGFTEVPSSQTFTLPCSDIAWNLILNSIELTEWLLSGRPDKPSSRNNDEPWLWFQHLFISWICASGGVVDVGLLWTGISWMGQNISKEYAKEKDYKSQSKCQDVFVVSCPNACLLLVWHESWEWGFATRHFPSRLWTCRAVEFHPVPFHPGGPLELGESCSDLDPCSTLRSVCVWVGVCLCLWLWMRH